MSEDRGGPEPAAASAAMGSSMSIEALAETAAGGGWLVRSPRVGLYRGCPRPGGFRAGGDPAGRLTVLNRTLEVVLPAGVRGIVAQVRIDDRSVAVEYGQPLFSLIPAADMSASAEAASHAAGLPAEAAGGSRSTAGLPEGCLPVACPIDGVFYRRPSPGAAPFVEPGAVVEPGRTLGLIEAMKSFNAVLYGGPGLPQRAVIVEARAADAAEVRQGALLFVVRPA